MKKHLLLFIGLLFIPYYFLLAQRTTKETSSPVQTINQQDLDNLPFAKGKWEFLVDRQELGYSHLNTQTNGVSQGSQSQFTLNLGTNYYVANHVGIGLELNTNFTTVKNNYKSVSDQYMAYANLTYGNTVGDNFNFYARAGIGLGNATSKFTPANGSTITDKSDLFGYKLDVGFPIQLGHNQPVYLTPQFNYRYLREKVTGAIETDDRFGFCLDLEAYLFCHEMRCDSHHGYSFSHNIYNQGHSYLGVNTRGRLDFGTIKTVYDNNFPEVKETYSKQDFSANYMYYFIKDLAVGLDIDFGNSVYNTTTANNKQSNLSYIFEPMLEFNLPVQQPGWNNLFLMSGYGFGASRSEFTNGNTTSTVKYSTTEFCAGLGYNFFFTKSLSFTPIFQYVESTSKNKSTDIKSKTDGPELAIGLRRFFGR